MITNGWIVSIFTSIVSFAVGYTFAKIPRLGDKRATSASTKASGQQNASDANTERVYADMGGEYKMVLVVRNDLKMGKGKIAAQCGHAAVGAFETGLAKTPAAVKKWQHSGQAKIALKVESEQAMMEVYRIAKTNNLNCCVIRDAGRTQIEPNTKTVLAIGPAPIAAVDAVTGHLKLL
ncbi:probable peptidyl-tRNA hydrolase 2 [Anopheles nili]|uniref:probable peptidyl-tRNA hydrolase 2 n=1 Tax=Anopheles nili TaxID=185578 RepID=UPI00237A9987|nr:probable peptidyl-tRNA hydrolase 2 [Anopheles nili]